jgi:hypothetical protein
MPNALNGYANDYRHYSIDGSGGKRKGILSKSSSAPPLKRGTMFFKGGELEKEKYLWTYCTIKQLGVN